MDMQLRHRRNRLLSTQTKLRDSLQSMQMLALSVEAPESRALIKAIELLELALHLLAESQPEPDTKLHHRTRDS